MRPCYTHKAFGIHFLTFLVAFTVMCSGVTSASTAANAFAANLADGFGLDGENSTLVLGIALAFMLLVAAVNFRGVSEGVKANVVLTAVELSACCSSSSSASTPRPVARPTSPGSPSSTRRATRERLPRDHRRHVLGVLRHGGASRMP